MGAKQCSGYERERGDGRLVDFSQGDVTQDVSHFGCTAFILQLTLIGFYCLTEYEFASTSVFDSTTAFTFFSGILMFMLAGFGFSGAWMKAFGMSAFGFTMIIMVFTLQEAVLVEGWMKQENMHLQLSIQNLINASFCVVAVLISWGALAGKVSPLVMLWFSACEVGIFYVNKIHVLTNTFQVTDPGGAISVHTFGAFFGVACSLGMGLIPWIELHTPTYASEVFANVGVCFMWIFFPWFVSSALPMNTAEQRTAILGTIFALMGSTGAAFSTGPMFNPTGAILTPQMLRLATLSGGVAISCVANKQLGPGGALIIGTLGGTITSYLCHLQNDSRRPLIEKLELADSYGVMWLSGIPGIFSACVSMVLPEIMANTGILWSDQLLGLLCTISIASISGFIIGRIAKCSGKLFPIPDLDFNDSTYWKTSQDIPNQGYFDQQGN